MADDEPREYDHEFETVLSHKARRRTWLTLGDNTAARFAVQLEYRLGDEWVEVVRSDHDPASEMGHDVTEEGVHLDIYREGEKIRAEEIFPPMPADHALNAVQNHISEQAEGYVKRFEKWHDINPSDR